MIFGPKFDYVNGAQGITDARSRLFEQDGVFSRLLFVFGGAWTLSLNCQLSVRLCEFYSRFSFLRQIWLEGSGSWALPIDQVVLILMSVRYNPLRNPLFLRESLRAMMVSLLAREWSLRSALQVDSAVAVGTWLEFDLRITVLNSSQIFVESTSAGFKRRIGFDVRDD